MKNIVSFLSLAVFCFLSTATYSQTTYTGAIGITDLGDWADPGNWSNGLPAIGNDATIPAGKSVFIIGTVINNGYIYNNGAIQNAGNIDNNGTIDNNGNSSSACK